MKGHCLVLFFTSQTSLHLWPVSHGQTWTSFGLSLESTSTLLHSDSSWTYLQGLDWSPECTVCTAPYNPVLNLSLLSFCVSMWPNSEAVPGHLRVHQGRETVLLQSSEVLWGRPCFGGGHDGRFCWDFQYWSGGFPTVSEEVCGESQDTNVRLITGPMRSEKLILWHVRSSAVSPSYTLYCSFWLLSTAILIYISVASSQYTVHVRIYFGPGILHPDCIKIIPSRFMWEEALVQFLIVAQSWCQPYKHPHRASWASSF